MTYLVVIYRVSNCEVFLSIYKMEFAPVGIISDYDKDHGLEKRKWKLIKSILLF